MKLVFATNNLNKLSEIKSLVSSKFEILSLQDINCLEEIPEPYLTLEENALHKARFVFENYGFNCFSDDTGLEVNVLGGEPGVYSARYAGDKCNALDNMHKLLLKLKNKTNRIAKFRTIVALVINNEEFIFEGICSGNISLENKGVNGFGYYAVFIPDGYNITFAEMNKNQKGTISHRGKAVKKLVDFLQDN